MDEIPEITVEEIIDRYAVLLLDAFGVLVHASGVFPGAVELIEGLRRSGKSYYVLTNDASMLPTTRAKRYHRFGLVLDPERIITSGLLLKGHFEAHHLQGARCVVLGPEESAQYVAQAGGQVVAPIDPFEVLVIGDESGFPFLETVDAVLSTLCHQLDRQEEVHLILPNPDLIYPRGEQGFGIASGGVALLFEAALHLRYPERPELRFTRLGKPHPAIFAEALRYSGTKDMVMIGDQLETDVRGANAFGLDSVLVSTGVTASATAALPAELRPTYRLRALLPACAGGQI
jgi:HAD superfamily hydrolase (TIGR01450 family)